MMHRARTENYLCDSSSFYVMLATAARLLLLLQQPVFGGDTTRTTKQQTTKIKQDLQFSKKNVQTTAHPVDG